MTKTLLRAGALSCALLASTCMTPAMAQDEPAYRALDANGVDLTHGDFVMSLVEGVIGSGQGALALVRDGAWYSGFNGHQWDGIMLTEFSTLRGVAMDRRTEYFTGTTAQQANGSTLAMSGANYIHQRADGTTTVFSKAIPSCTPGSSNSCLWVPTEIATPDGRTISLTWDQWQICPDVPIDPENPCAVDSIRLASVANGRGHSIVFTHASGGSGSGSGTSGPGPSWFQRTRADFYNSAAGSASQANVTYAYPSIGVMEVTDMGGRVWRIAGSEYQITGIRRPDASSDTTTIARSSGVVTSVTRDGVTTGYSRSVSGTTATMTVTDANNEQTVIVSDLAIGRPTSVTDPLNRTTSYQYDSAGRLTRVTAPLGNYVATTYDARGNVTETRAVAQSGSGLPDIVTSASFDATCANPVTCNRPNSTTDAQGHTTDYTYDSTHGGVLTVTGPTVDLGRAQTRYGYTLDSGTGEYRLTQISACITGGASSCVGTANEARTVIGYDANGNVASIERRDGTGALSATSAMTYTPLGDVETVDGPLAGTADTTRYRYNAARQPVGVIGPDPDGSGSGNPLQHRATRIVHDSATGLATAVQRGSVASQSDSDWAGFSPVEEVQTAYDANARPVVQRLVSGSTTYALTQTSYDPLGQPECVAQRMNPAEFAPSSLPADACTLDTAGSHGPDRITRTTRDEAGQVTLVQTGYGVSGVQADEVATTYTANGQAATLTDGEGNTTTYAYDGHDRLSRTCFAGTTSCATTPGGAADYEQLTYATHASGTLTSGQVASRRQRDGTSLGMTYDAMGRLATLDVPSNSYWEGDLTFYYDLLGRRTLTVDQWTYSTRLSWDALGRLVADRQLVQMDMTYDAAGRLTRMSWPDGFHVDYDHLVTGEVRSIRENGVTTPLSCHGQSSCVLAVYDYDQLGRRTTLTRGNGTVTSYAYDPVSRLSQLGQNFAGTSDDLTLDFTHNPAAQIAGLTRSNDAFAYTARVNANVTDTVNALNQVTQTGSTSVSHDARGNTSAIGSASYAYSPLNRLATAPGGVNLTYYVDGRLLDASTNGQGPLFAYVGGTMVGEYDGSLALQRRYVHGPGTDEPLVWYEGSGTSDRRWLHADERGSIIARSNDQGAVTSVNAYDEYGVPASGNDGRFQYTGQPWIGPVGLYYYRARFYNPLHGRFMQADPIGYYGGMNQYVYPTDPVNFTDPLGLDVCSLPESQRDEVCGKPRVPQNNAPLVFGGRGGGGGGGGGGGDSVFGDPLCLIQPQCANKLPPLAPPPPPQLPPCPSGPMVTIGDSYGFTIFLFGRGISVNAEVGLAVPTAGGLRGSQGYLTFSTTGMEGLGLYGGGGESITAGFTDGPIRSGYSESQVLQGGAAWGRGGEASYTTRGGNSASLSGGARGAAGAYFGGGQRHSHTFATPPVGCR